MLMLDGDESLWRDEYDDSPSKPAAAARPKIANRQDRRPAKVEEDTSFDKYLGGMPGVGDMASEELVMNEMLVSVLDSTCCMALGLQYCATLALGTADVA